MTATPSAEGLERKLLPCPFCGCNARVMRRAPYNNNSCWAIDCLECGAENRSFPDEKSAIAAWNRRPSAPERARIRGEAFEEAAKVIDAKIVATRELASFTVHNEGERHLQLAILGRLDGYTELAHAIRALSDQPATEDTVRGELVEALKWYGEQARLARLIHSEGDAGRHALADDGGKRARSLLSRAEATEGR